MRGHPESIVLGEGVLEGGEVAEVHVAVHVGEMMRTISVRLDDESGSLDPKDDVTIVGMDVPEPVTNR